MADVLVVVADTDSLTADIVRTFFHDDVVQGQAEQPLVALLVGGRRERLCFNFPEIRRRAASLPRDGFLVLTAPRDNAPGLSVSRVQPRARLN